MSIVITTPTGNIGSKLVEKLLAEGQNLTLIVRDPAKLSDDVRGAVTVKQGDLTDAAFVRTATEGAEALFWLSPPNLTVPDVHAFYSSLYSAAAEAVTANRIGHVVLISGGGGGRRDAGTASHLFATEDALNATGANVLSLRCGYFMENFLTYLPTLKSDGAWYGLNRPELAVPFVATQDIATVAARKLLQRDWTGQSHVAVHGAADVTFAEAASILTDATGKTIRYVQVPAEGMLHAL
ncbi:MAG: NAD(P)H-binding protein, partial [Cytophagales bacterium]|nr:NAD(P)H-binding protein [Armatimonadota bacterium]